MLITFTTRARYPNITMFGGVALQLLKLMGRSETVPSAIEPEDIPDALDRLRKGLTIEEELNAGSQPTDKSDDEELSVGIGTRAGPLIEMLEAALKANVAVMWEAA